MKTFLGCAFVLLLSACGSSDPDSSTSPATTPSTAAPITTTVAPTTMPEETTVPDSVALADPVEVADASIVELDDDITINTTVYSLTMDAGTEWELPLHIAIPNRWKWDPATSTFTDGRATIELSTGCAPDCLATAWDVSITQAGGFLHDPMAGLPDGGLEGFGSSAGGNEGSTTRDRVFDDGSGRSSTALYNNAGARWLGCTVDVPAGAGANVETLGRLCQAIVADWRTVVANTASPVINETVTAAVAALIADPTIGQPAQVVSLDEDNDRTVRMELPADASVNVDSFFGTEVFLGGAFSIFTDLTLNAACDGLCTAQDWGAKINSTDGEIGRTRAAITAESDTPIDSGWLIAGPTVDGGEHRAVVVRWDDDSDNYFSCSIEADRDDAERINELLAICLTAEPLWFG